MNRPCSILILLAAALCCHAPGWEAKITDTHPAAQHWPRRLPAKAAEYNTKFAARVRSAAKQCAAIEIGPTGTAINDNGARRDVYHTLSATEKSEVCSIFSKAEPVMHHHLTDIDYICFEIRFIATDGRIITTLSLYDFGSPDDGTLTNSTCIWLSGADKHRLGEIIESHMLPPAADR